MPLARAISSNQSDELAAYCVARRRMPTATIARSAKLTIRGRVSLVGLVPSTAIVGV
jgi:hypothetical protein